MANRNVAYSLKELREYVGLTQQELAWKAGISSVYVSLLEAREKSLTLEAAKKIASVYLELLQGVDKEIDQNFIEADEPLHEYLDELEREDEEIELAKELIANHRASNYPEELQGRIIILMNQITEMENELEYILDNNQFPPEEFSTPTNYVKNEYNLKQKIELFLEPNVRDNVVKLKASYKNRRKVV